MPNTDCGDFFDSKFFLKKSLLNDFINKLELDCIEQNFKQENLEKLTQFQNGFLQKNQQILNLPQYRKQKIFNVFYILRALNKAIKKYKNLSNVSLSAQAEKEHQNILNILSDLKRNAKIFFHKQINPEELKRRLDEIFFYLSVHTNLVGREQAIKDLQLGLNLLNKKRLNFKLGNENYLKEDGILGEKTQSCLCKLCKNYSSKVIKKYIKRGIQNNIIFDTKNKSDVDTSKMLKEICTNIEREI